MAIGTYGSPAHLVLDVVKQLDVVNQYKSQYLQYIVWEPVLVRYSTVVAIGTYGSPALLVLDVVVRSWGR